MSEDRSGPADREDEPATEVIPVARPLPSDREEAVEELAVTQGFATPEQSHAALVVSRLTRTPVAQVLAQNHVVDEEKARVLDEEVNDHLVPGYRVVEKVGAGRHGIVYRAIQKCLRREVALKVVALHSARDEAASERLREEARSSARLQHPNLVLTYDYGEHGGRAYLAMEFVEGMTCARALELRGRPFPVPEALGIVRAVADALAAAHREGIHHRDVKPSSILLPTGGGPSSAKLADIGLSFDAVADPSLENGLPGTPGYMAPEQAAGEATDQRADVYGLGATLYHLVTGRRPFAAPEPFAVLLRQVSERLPDPREADPTIPPALVQLLQGMLARHAESRQDDWYRLIEDMDRVAAGRAPLFPLPVLPDQTIRTLGLPVSDEEPLLVELDSRIAVYKKDGGSLVRLTELGKPRGLAG